MCSTASDWKDARGSCSASSWVKQAARNGVCEPQESPLHLALTSALFWWAKSHLEDLTRDSDSETFSKFWLQLKAPVFWVLLWGLQSSLFITLWLVSWWKKTQFDPKEGVSTPASFLLCQKIQIALLHFKALAAHFETWPSLIGLHYIKKMFGEKGRGKLLSKTFVATAQGSIVS